MTTPNPKEFTLNNVLVETNQDILSALANVNASLRIVLAAIQEMQREMGLTAPPSSSVPLRPDPSWVGTP